MINFSWIYFIYRGHHLLVSTGEKLRVQKEGRSSSSKRCHEFTYANYPKHYGYTHLWSIGLHDWSQKNYFENISRPHPVYSSYGLDQERKFYQLDVYFTTGL